MNPTKRVSVWSGPRNVSTALMYSFRERSDTMVVDEPLYGHYLKLTDAPHPGKAEVLAQMESDGERVVREILLGTYTKPVVMFKNMAHHLTGLERAFLAQLQNVLLIRDPEEMLSSLARQLPEPTLRDTGLGEQVEILEAVLRLGGHLSLSKRRRFRNIPKPFCVGCAVAWRSFSSPLCSHGRKARNRRTACGRNTGTKTFTGLPALFLINLGRHRFPSP